MQIRIYALVAVLTLIGLARTTELLAADANWNVNAAGNWNDDSNWLPAAHPNGVGDIAGLVNDITAARIVTLNGPNTIGTLNIGDSTGAFFAFTLGGTNPLTLNNGGSGAAINKAVSTATDVISAPIWLADNLSVTTTGGALTISGVISETGGSRSLTKLGATTLTLSGANTYTGNTVISGGTLSVGGSSIPDGIGRGNVVLQNAGSTLVITGNETINGLTGDTGTIVTASGSPRFFIVGANGASSTFSGQLTGGANLALHKMRDGTLTLNGDTAHTYTSQTRIFGGSGTLELDFANLASGTNLINSASQLRMGGGTLRVIGKTGGGNVTSQTFTPALLVDGGASAMVVNSNGGDGTTLNLSSTFTRAAIGTIDFSTVGPNATITTGKANDAAGIIGGYATYAGSSYARQSGSNTIESLPDASYLTTVFAGDSSAGYAATDNVDVNSNQILDGAVAVSTLRFNDATAARTLTLQGTNTTNGILVTANVGNQLSLITGGAIQGNLVGGATTRDLIVHQYNTAGTLEIASQIVDNTAATHLVKVGPGTLRISSTSNNFTGQVQILTGTLQLGNSGVIPDAAVVALNSATLDLNGLSEGIGNLFGLETSVVTNSAAGPATLTVNGGSLTYPGVIQNGSGVVSLNKITTANQTLSGANTFTGATTVSAGTVTLANTNALQNSTLDLSGGSVIFSSAVAGNAFTIGGLSGSNNIALSTNAPVTPVTLSLGNNGEHTTYSGVLSGAGSIVKVGGGTTTLDGNNTYTGTTTVNAGTLLINGTTTGTGAVAVNGGTLGGNGTLPAPVTVSAGGNLAPGVGVGTLTTGDVTLGGTLKIEYNGSVIDKLIAGALDITSATVDFDDLGGGLTGAPHVFASYTSLVGGEFDSVSGVPTGYTINYNYLGGNQIALVSSALAGDFDSDGDVDGADFVAWQTNFPTTSGASLDDGDSDLDGDVDGADFAAWQNSFPSSPGASPVPEPHAVLLLSIGTVVAVGAARQRRGRTSKGCLPQPKN